MGSLNFLTVVLVIAKLAGYFDHSWLLVFLPTFIWASLFAVLLTIAGIVGVVKELNNTKRR